MENVKLVWWRYVCLVIHSELPKIFVFLVYIFIQELCSYLMFWEYKINYSCEGNKSIIFACIAKMPLNTFLVREFLL